MRITAVLVVSAVVLGCMFALWACSPGAGACRAVSLLIPEQVASKVERFDVSPPGCSATCTHFPDGGGRGCAIVYVQAPTRVDSCHVQVFFSDATSNEIDLRVTDEPCPLPAVHLDAGLD